MTTTLAPRAAGEIQISALPEASLPINLNDITNIKQGVEDRKVRVEDLLAPHASKTGNVHGMKPADMGLGNVKDYPITDAVNDKDSAKYASAMAVALVSERLDKMFPVNHIMMSLNPANPASYGYVGTWQLIGKGRTIVGFDPDNAQRPVGTEFGSEMVTLGINHLPAHTVKLTGTVAAAGDHLHTFNVNTTGAGGHNHSGSGNTAGSGGHAHNINFNSQGNGAHSHSFSGNTSQIGNHNHGAPVEADWNDYPTANVPASNWSGGRRVFYGSRSSTSWDGAHAHSFSGGTSNVGNHVHQIYGDTAWAGDHVHSYSFTVNSVGDHVHNVSGSTSTTGGHTHNIDMVSQSVGGGQAFSVAQLSLVAYIWVRTA